ncbi:MAG TPA: HAMP domain-containing sensor histidine kinase [Chloroflexota bacterium]|nr:HAMP domain-containing sensor histidine kinase [Chloroflexota bacterium]
MQLSREEDQEPGAAEIEEFMSVAAHDLRNPIAVVRASAQMAQRQIGRGDPEGAHRRMGAIVEQTDRLTEVLEMFLDAARIGATRLPLRPEHMDLRDVIDAATEKARAMIGEHGDRVIEVDVPEALAGSWDRARVVRAIHALIANALLYGDPSAPVRVCARCVGGRVQVDVSGGGPGPDREETTHLFERFYRGRSAANAGHSGSGLGLFTARGIARMHGGDVRRIEGDRFQIELPLSD